MIADAIIVFVISILLTLIFDQQVPLVLVFALDLVEIGIIIEAGNFVPDTVFYIFLLVASMFYAVLKLIRITQELNTDKDK